MDLVLWRHADAENAGGGPDAERKLTKKGHKQAARGAEWLRERLAGDFRILVSPAVRALETVEPLGIDAEESEEVGLSATVASVLRGAGWPDGGLVVVVGHQPTLGEVAEHLLGHDVEVRKGAILWLVTDSHSTKLEAHFEP
jgi:phosphohistidine phosphatase